MKMSELFANAIGNNFRKLIYHSTTLGINQSIIFLKPTGLKLKEFVF